jgi:alpha-beta hydrolase superfamily lysophospholipase
MTEILLVHGAWHGPWCWDNFVQHLISQGYEVRAVKLRGHDRPQYRIWHRIHDYVEDLKQATTVCSKPPALVGHSMGGLVVQKYLEHNPAAGAVLIASVPIDGTFRAVARQAVQHPVPLLKSTLSLRLSSFINTPEIVRELFFTTDTPQTIVDNCYERLQDESFLAFLDMLVLPSARHVRVPMLVLGAERDAIFTTDEVHRTARAYRTEAEIFAGIGHDMMLDKGWSDVVDRIDAWLRKVV